MTHVICVIAFPLISYCDIKKKGRHLKRWVHAEQPAHLRWITVCLGLVEEDGVCSGVVWWVGLKSQFWEGQNNMQKNLKYSKEILQLQTKISTDQVSMFLQVFLAATLLFFPGWFCVNEQTAKH